MLNRFGKWFSSSAGVWQTTGVVVMWWVAEFTGYLHDPQHFQLCVWLTIYSAITQPVLAWVNRRDAARLDEIVARVETIVTRIEAKEDAELDLLTKGDS